ncbi:hypothetical protein D3C72_1397290 [compost metagenome]
MPTFEQPPEWWVSLANLTQWLYWPAWASIFTLLALLNTARLADRSNRETRHKDAVFLMATRELLIDFIQFLDAGDDSFYDFAQARGHIVGGETWTPAVKKLIAGQFRAANEKVWEDDRIVEQLDAIKLSDFPTVPAFLTFSSARICVGMVRDGISKFSGSDVEIDQIDGWVSGIKGEIERLKYIAAHLSRQAITDYDSTPLGPPRALSLKPLWSWLCTSLTTLPVPWRR